VYELTLDDFRHFGAWFFPMDESVEDELTVRPLVDKEVCSDYPIIVSTIFFNDLFEKYAARAGSSG